MKDVVSIPGVSLHYLLGGLVEQGTELYSAGREVYEMLKGAVVGRPSIVFTWYHKVGVMRIRDHQFREPRTCKQILGYDANMLYLLTMLSEVPCGKEKVVQHSAECCTGGVGANTKAQRWELVWIRRSRHGILEHLWPNFEEMSPFFFNKQVPDAQGFH